VLLAQEELENQQCKLIIKKSTVQFTQNVFVEEYGKVFYYKHRPVNIFIHFIVQLKTLIENKSL
jgi:hypothetical protein